MISARGGPNKHDTQSPDIQNFEAYLMKTMDEQPELAGVVQSMNPISYRHSYHLVTFLLSTHWDGMRTE